MDTLEKDYPDAEKQEADKPEPRLYRITPGIISCRDKPAEESLSDLLLRFDSLFSEKGQTKLFKVVTVPWKKYDLGWKVAAFQIFQETKGFATLVDDPEEDKVYKFYEGVARIKTAPVRLMVGGLKGLFFGMKMKMVLYEELNNDIDKWVNHDPYDCREWYHYLGTHKELLWELEEKSIQAKVVFGR